MYLPLIRPSQSEAGRQLGASSELWTDMYSNIQETCLNVLSLQNREFSREQGFLTLLFVKLQKEDYFATRLSHLVLFLHVNSERGHL